MSQSLTVAIVGIKFKSTLVMFDFDYRNYLTKFAVRKKKKKNNIFKRLNKKKL